jgi:hypothetical protein
MNNPNRLQDGCRCVFIFSKVFFLLAASGPDFKGRLCGPDPSEQSPLLELLLIQTEVVTELMDVGHPDLLEEHIGGFVRKIPQIFQKEEDLERDPGGGGFPDGISHEHPQQIRIPSIPEERLARIGLIGHRHLLGMPSQIIRQGLDHPGHLIPGRPEQFIPMVVVGGHRTEQDPKGTSRVDRNPLGLPAPHLENKTSQKHRTLEARSLAAPA